MSNDFNVDGYDEDFSELPNTKQTQKKEYLADEIEEDEDYQVQEPKTETFEEKSFENQNVQQKKEEKHDGKIKIDIGSVEKLTGALKFAAANLENSVAKVENVEKLSEVLNLLQSIDQNKYHDFFEKFEDKINLSKIDQKIETKINFVLNKKVKQIDDIFAQSSSKYQQYAEVFETPEIFDFFEEVKNLEKFRKKFRWKSIVFGSILAATISATVSGVAFYQLYQFQVTQAKKEIFDKKNAVLEIFQHAKNIQVAEDGTLKQIQFQSGDKKMNVGILKNGIMTVTYTK